MSSSVIVRVPTPLRIHTGGAAELSVRGRTVAEVLAAVGRDHDGLLQRVLSPEGAVRPFVNIFIGNDSISMRQGVDTPVRDGDVIAIIPSVAGGSGRARDQRLAELRARIPELEPARALEMQSDGGVLVDVREPEEIAAGSPEGALHLGRGYLELRIEEAVPELDRPLLVMCGGGTRSLFAAEDLLRLGYRRVYSVAGGFNRWKNQGLPFAVPRLLDTAARDRYSRHLLMPEVGAEGQLKLLASKVLLVGAGGLGSPAALYLAAAGVGTLGIVDHDTVDRSNLQRQILHTEARIGQLKVQSASSAIQALNTDVKVVQHPVRLSSANIDQIIADYDVVIDGTDNFPTRYLINDACIKHGIPNVYGAVFRFEGQVSVFWPGRPEQGGPCYRCLFPEPPPSELAPSCAEAGVLGVLPGVVGLLQAVETVKLLLGLGEPLVGRLLHFDALAGRFQELRFAPDPDCSHCAGDRAFPGYVDYELFCAG